MMQSEVAIETDGSGPTSEYCEWPLLCSSASLR